MAEEEQLQDAEVKHSSPEPGNHSLPFVEVRCTSSGEIRRFANGTDARFALSLINRKVGKRLPLASHIEAAKEKEEPVSFGPGAILVDYGDGWKLQTVTELEGTFMPEQIKARVPSAEGLRGEAHPKEDEFGTKELCLGFSYFRWMVGRSDHSSILRWRGFLLFYNFSVQFSGKLRPLQPSSGAFALIKKSSNTLKYLTNLLRTSMNENSKSLGKLLHGYLLRTGTFVDSFLTNCLIEFYFKFGNVSCARYLFDQMPHRNFYSWQTMLDGLCKNGHLTDARQLFVKMPLRNTMSWNTLISALSRYECELEALETYHTMRMEGFLLNNFTLATVLSVCGLLDDVKCGKQSHAIVVKIGLGDNMFVGNGLLVMYAKCNRISDSIKIFESLPKPNEVSFTTMIRGLADSGRVVEAAKVFRLMQESSLCRIDHVSLSTMLATFYSRQIHGLAFKLGFENDPYLSNSLLNMYVENDEMDDGEVVFASMAKRNSVSWNIMIGGYGRRKQISEALRHMQEMRLNGFEPDEITYINMIAACFISENVEIGRGIFNRITSRSVRLYNAMLTGYSRCGYLQDGITLFREMQFESIKPDETTLAVILTCCSDMGLVEFGRQIHAVSVRATLHFDVFVASGLICAYSKSNEIEIAKRVFRSQPVRDIGCWNSIIAGLSVNCLYEEALCLFKNMLDKGMSPTESSYANALASSAKLSFLTTGRQLHARMSRQGFTSDVFVGSALINMYSKCGHLDEARHFFDTMVSKNTITWNEMIHGYAQNGLGHEAVALYEDMIGSSCLKPDHVTFISVLTACSRSGMVDLGLKIFKSIQDPSLDHYICVIDLLARSGQFYEMEAILARIPFKNDDPIVWEILLSSCRIHGNVSLGKLAAEELRRLDPTKSGSYLLLANMFSSLGMWEESNLVRQKMIDNEVIKTSASSSFIDGELKRS